MKLLRIRRERINRGWTLGHVADCLDVAQQSIEKLEKGINAPSYENLCKLEKLFNLSHQELFAEVFDIKNANRKKS